MEAIMVDIMEAITVAITVDITEAITEAITDMTLIDFCHIYNMPNIYIND